MTELIEGAIFILCLGVSACFSGSETALTSMTKMRVKRLFNEDDPSYHRLESWLHEPNRYLATILVGNNFINIFASVLAANMSERILTTYYNFDNATAWGAAIAVAVTTSTFLIFGEIVPKTYCKEHAVRISQIVIGPLDLIWKFLHPIISVFLFISNNINRLLGAPHVKELPLITEDDVRQLIEMSEKEGVLEQDEREMIHSIIDFGDTLVKDIMTPRVDFQAIPLDLKPSAVRNEAVSVGRSRIPVYEDDLDHIAGILYAKDLLKYDNEQGVPLKDIVRPTLFVPKTKKVNELLDTFKQEKNHLAIVVDEYGLTAGLVTIEDVLEEIVGDIQDEYDTETPDYETREDGTVIADAKIDLDDLTDVFDVEFPEENVETLGGFVSTLLGRVPEIGEVAEFSNLRFKVLDSDERRVKTIEISTIEPDLTEQELNGA
ncbi:MAG: hemolysin family protein [Candidatus Hinthialibacter antarcticus]|nr:hemolysin family protein [Candidatus Hinthialibacter antarcticus]